MILYTLLSLFYQIEINRFHQKHYGIKKLILFFEFFQQMSQKKSAKKMLFGKLMKPMKSTPSEKLNEASGGVTSYQQEGY